MFRSCSPFQSTEFIINTKSKMSKKRQQKFGPISKGTYISSGYIKLDNELGGGFPRKSIVLLETDSDINKQIIIAFLATIMYNFIGTYNPILFGPFRIFEPVMVINYLKSYLQKEPRKELVKILWPTNKVKDSSSKHIIPYREYNSKGKVEFFQHQVSKLKEENPCKLLLNITGINKSKKMECFEKADEIEEIISFMRDNVDLSVFVIQRSQNINANFYDEYDIHMRLRIINGSLFLQLLSTNSPLYEIINETSAGYPKVKLEPIV
jgi:hypothetical protein